MTCIFLYFFYTKYDSGTFDGLSGRRTARDHLLQFGNRRSFARTDNLHAAEMSEARDDTLFLRDAQQPIHYRRRTFHAMEDITFSPRARGSHDALCGPARLLLYGRIHTIKILDQAPGNFVTRIDRFFPRDSQRLVRDDRELAGPVNYCTNHKTSCTFQRNVAMKLTRRSTTDDRSSS